MVHGLVIVLMLLCFGCDGDGDGSAGETAQRRCVRMRDHLIDLRLDAVAERAPPAETKLPGARARWNDTAAPARRVDLRAQHRASLVSALGNDFAERCAQTMAASEIDCVIGAVDQDAAAACGASNR